jgi:opacity protein-like surface antigen
MNARPFMIGCVLAVGTSGSVMAADVTAVVHTFIAGGSAGSRTSGYEGSDASHGGGRDSGDSSANHTSAPAKDSDATAPSTPTDNYELNHGNVAPSQDKSATGIGWQSLLPGSIQ